MHAHIAIPQSCVSCGAIKFQTVQPVPLTWTRSNSFKVCSKVKRLKMPRKSPQKVQSWCRTLMLLLQIITDYWRESLFQSPFVPCSNYCTTHTRVMHQNKITNRHYDFLLCFDFLLLFFFLFPFFLFFAFFPLFFFFLLFFPKCLK